MKKEKQKTITIKHVIIAGKMYLLKEDIEKYLEPLGVKLTQVD